MSSHSLSKILIYGVAITLCVSMGVLQPTERTTLWSQFSPSTFLWVPEMGTGCHGCTTSAFTHYAILLAFLVLFPDLLANCLCHNPPGWYPHHCCPENRFPHITIFPALITFFTVHKKTPVFVSTTLPHSVCSFVGLFVSRQVESWLALNSQD